MTTAELIEKLERANGPSRELDAEIKAHVYGGTAMQSPFNGNWCVYQAGASDPRRDRVMERPRHVLHEVWANDRYTASIDAAIGLVPEGWGWTLQSDGGPGPMAFVKGCERYQVGFTPAIAICIAALKAKEADNGKSC